MEVHQPVEAPASTLVAAEESVPTKFGWHKALVYMWGRQRGDGEEVLQGGEVGLLVGK